MFALVFGNCGFGAVGTAGEHRLLGALSCIAQADADLTPVPRQLESMVPRQFFW